MKSKTNSKRLTRAILIGLVGVLVLSVSAFAAWGSSTGYGKYKDAVTKVFTDTDNVTINAEMSILYDGDTAHQSETMWKIDGTDYSSYENTGVVNEDGETAVYYYSVLGTTQTCFYSTEDWYEQYERDMNSAENPLSLGEYGDKVVKFGKLCADTVVGDLKNNVVLVDDKNGIRSYTLDVTADQIPALISSGLDLLMTMEGSDSGYVTFENFEESFAAYYQKTKGEALPSDYFDILYADDASPEMWEEHNALSEEMNANYEEIRLKSGGDAILLVNADGTYDVYENYAAYAFATEYGSMDFAAYLGTDPVLHKVKFDFSLDEKDRLVANDISVLFKTTDPNGKDHTVDFRFCVDFSDYGTTKVEAVDPGDRTLRTE